MKSENYSERLYLANEVRLRTENFGGLVFDRRDGALLEVDRPGFELLSQARSGGIYPDDPKNSAQFIDRLLQLRILEKSDRHIDSSDTNSLEIERSSKIKEGGFSYPPQKEYRGLENPRSVEEKILRDYYETIWNRETLAVRCDFPWLSAPETVHWAITYRCGMKCPDCYSSRVGFSGRELDTSESKIMIEKLAGWKVFQLAIGGGEPLERVDIAELVKHASACGLTVHLTTGRQFINGDLLDELSGSLTSLQLGIHANWLQTPDWRSYLHDLESLMERASDNGIKIGANLCLSRNTLDNFGLLLGELGNIGLRRFTMLRYKPPLSIKRWREELPEREQLLELKPELEKLSAIPGVDLRIDCAFSFLQCDLTSTVAMEHGIIGCSAGNRIAAIAPDGSLYPCSQLVIPKLCVGNVYSDSLDKIWHDSRILRKYRFFRNKESFTGSYCGYCTAREHCGGCRTFAHDALGGDPGCPAPQKPPLRHCGKKGRMADFTGYLEHRGQVTVGEYMGRYGIGQKNAIKEMRKIGAVPVVPRTGRKKRDAYRVTRNIYCALPQADEWSGFDDRDYPEWIISLNDREYPTIGEEDEDYF